MGKRGPAPKPTKLRIIEGNRSRRPLPTNEPEPKAVESMCCPRWLEGEARREWRRVQRVLRDMGLLTEADRSVIAAYCQEYGEVVEATRDVKRFGAYSVTPKGYMMDSAPALRRSRAVRAMHRLAQSLGLSPSARVGLAVKEGEKEDPLDALRRQANEAAASRRRVTS